MQDFVIYFLVWDAQVLEVLAFVSFHHHDSVIGNCHLKVKRKQTCATYQFKLTFKYVEIGEQMSWQKCKLWGMKLILFLEEKRREKKRKNVWICYRDWSHHKGPDFQFGFISYWNLWKPWFINKKRDNRFTFLPLPLMTNDVEIYFPMRISFWNNEESADWKVGCIKKNFQSQQKTCFTLGQLWIEWLIACTIFLSHQVIVCFCPLK